MPTSRKTDKFPLILISLCVIFLVVGFGFNFIKSIVVSLTQKPVEVNNSTPPTPTPTPIGLAYKTFVEKAETFALSFDASWSAQPSITTKDITTTNFIACDKTTLQLVQIKNPTDLAETYLGLTTEPSQSRINGRVAVMASATNSAVMVIEDTQNAQNIILRYRPTCGLNIEQGKEREFLPLLNSFTFY